jgi:hypothetical protein
LPGEAEENHENPQSRYPVCWQRFDPGTPKYDEIQQLNSDPLFTVKAVIL